jgi:hypothetical protein
MVSGVFTLWKIFHALKDIQRVLWTIGGDRLDKLDGEISSIGRAVERMYVP